MESRGTSSGSNKPGKVTKSVPRALSSGSIIECTERSSNRNRGLQRLLSPLTALERVSDFDNDFKSKNLRRPRPNLLNRPSATRRRCPEIHPRKRAVLCGVTYRNSKFRLKGTVNDVKSMRDLLINRFGYSQECIRVLTEEEEEPAFYPTKKNIQEALKWLVEGSESGDYLVFYFSGHGLRQPDFNDDERDGFDETICPVDFRQEGMILDKDINSTIVRPLKKGVTLHAIFDACHSGTILDLEYLYNPKTSKWDDNSAPSKAQKSTSGGIAISLSACEDDQMAADTSYFTGEAMAGAMTSGLIQTLDRNKKLTYGSLLERTHETLEQINSGWFSSYYSGWCLNFKLLQKLFHYRIIQDPLLSSSEVFDVDKKEFVL